MACWGTPTLRMTVVERGAAGSASAVWVRPVLGRYCFVGEPSKAARQLRRSRPLKTSSLSGFCPEACFRRIAPATCANDLPLETVGDRYEPLDSDGMWTKRGPSLARREGCLVCPAADAFAPLLVSVVSSLIVPSTPTGDRDLAGQGRLGTA